jgi:beta-mannosidase
LPQQPSEGSSSYYGVGAYLRPPSDARTSALKFASECLAFANVPASSTIARMPGGEALRPHHPQWKERTPRDLGAGWDFEDVRDHYLQHLYGVDARQLRSTDVDRYLALSRKIAGDVMTQAFAEWRRPGSTCGGALVLMLRDLWAGAGWGLLDDRGIAKPCWYALARALQPVTVTITDEGMNGLHAHVLNDTAQSRRLQLRMRAWRDGEVQVAAAQSAVEIEAHGACTIPLASMLDHFMDLNWSHRFGPPPCDVVSCFLEDESGAVIARVHHVLHSRFVSARDELGLSASSRQSGDHEWEVTITTRRFAWGVRLDWDGLVPDEDWFDLAPGDTARILLRGTPARYASPSVHALNAREPASITEARA